MPDQDEYHLVEDEDVLDLAIERVDRHNGIQTVTRHAPAVFLSHYEAPPYILPEDRKQNNGIVGEIVDETKDLLVQESGALVASNIAVQASSTFLKGVGLLTGIGLVFEKIPLIGQAIYRARKESFTEYEAKDYPYLLRLLELTKLSDKYEPQLLALAKTEEGRKKLRSAEEVMHILHADFWHDVGYTALNPLLLSYFYCCAPEMFQGHEWAVNTASFIAAVPIAVIVRRLMNHLTGVKPISQSI